MTIKKLNPTIEAIWGSERRRKADDAERVRDLGLHPSTGQVSVRLMLCFSCLTARVIHKNRRKKAPLFLAHS